MSRTPAALFLLADHREREALAEAACVRRLSPVPPGPSPGARATLRRWSAVARTIAVVVARRPFGSLRREAATLLVRLGHVSGSDSVLSMIRRQP
jgi:hypothetical protein